MSKKKFDLNNPYLFGFLMFLLAVTLIASKGVLHKEPTTLELHEFAQCVTEKGGVLYGTEWCQYTQKQKSFFESAVINLNYVNCDENQNECIVQGISGYPTWKFRDKTYSGVQSLNDLGKASGCSL